MNLRDARAAALTRWHRDLADNFTAALPKLLDDLERADRDHVPPLTVDMSGDLTEEQLAGLRAKFAEAIRTEPAKIIAGPAHPSDSEIEAWIEANPDKFAAWQRKRNRINGAPPPFDTPKPPARRRTTRKTEA